MVEFSV